MLAFSLGRVEDTWTYLARSLADREPDMIWLKVEPHWTELRGDERFAEIVDQVLPPMSPTPVRTMD